MSWLNTFPNPPRWSDEQIEKDVHRSRSIFRQDRLEEPLEAYLEAFDEIQITINDLLKSTGDLSKLNEKALELLSDPKMLTSLRYLIGPPISTDDLKTLPDADSLSPSYLKKHPDLVEQVVGTIMAGLDRRRFSWVVENREPTESERYAAIIASTALIAAQRVATKRRNEGKTTQEKLVRDSLLDKGLQEISIAGKSIQSLTEAPKPGQFCREVLLGSKKADLVVGLWGKRVVPIECKVSNSSVNSFKRLNHEAAGKAKEWTTEFGSRNVVPVAVLGGVYNSRNVQLAQANGLAIIWAYRLEDLTDWIGIVRESFGDDTSS